jgi:hypothetical protein
VWEILERKARASDEFYSGRITREEWKREGNEVDRLKEEIDEKGTARDKLILDLYTEITIEPGNLPVPVVFRELSLEKFYQLRSQIEPLTEDEVAEALHKQKEANERKFEEFHKRTRGSCSYRGFSLAKP